MPIYYISNFKKVNAKFNCQERYRIQFFTVSINNNLAVYATRAIWAFKYQSTYHSPVHPITMIGRLLPICSVSLSLIIPIQGLTKNVTAENKKIIIYTRS